MNPAHYRVRLLLDICRAFGLPAAIFSLALKLGQYSLGLLAIPAYVGFIALWMICKNYYGQYVQDREARAFGARPVPQVIGKWPGNIDVLLKMMHAFKTSYILDVYLQLFEEYQCTTLNTRILWSDNIISMDQEHSKFVLATGFQQFHRGKYQKERMETFLGQGIFNRDDDLWKMHRTMARPFFARDRIRDVEIFEKYSTRTLALISSLETSGQPCDVQDLYSRFTLDTASEFLFGTNLDTLSAKLPVPGKTVIGPRGSATDDSFGSFVVAFETCQQNITARGRIGKIWPLFEFFEDKNEKHVKAIQQYLDPLVERALEEKAHAEKIGTPSSIENKNFLQHLADSTEDPVLIRDELLSMLLASRDTTAVVLSFIMYFMAIHPAVAEKMRSEILEYCGAHDAPTFEKLRHLKYVRAVINETLRLFPPVPLNVRETRSSPCVLPPSDPTYHNQSCDPRPLYVPPNTIFMYLPLLMQRNSALWGPDADDFNPERWLQPESIAHFVSNPAMFAPFSAGPRICIGQNYAYNEMTYFLARLLQQFSQFSLVPEVQPEGSLPPPEWKERKGRQQIEQVWPSAALTLYIKGGLWIRFHRAT